jgi:hypothetical protein
VDATGKLIEMPVHVASKHYDVLKAVAVKHVSLEAFSGDTGYQNNLSKQC